MSLRGAISLLGDELARFHRMIEALEHEAETHHKRHIQAGSPKDPSFSQEHQQHPSLFSPAQSGTASRRGL